MSENIKYTILEVLSEIDVTSDYESVVNRDLKYPVVSVVCVVKTCRGEIIEHKTNWLKPLWEEKKRDGYYFAPEYIEEYD